MNDSSLFIDEVQGHQGRWTKLVEFTHSSTKAALFMLLAAVASLFIVNTFLYSTFEELIHVEVGFVIAGQAYTMSVVHAINDILMAVFFLLVGLEIKYEMTVGELTNIRQALLPIVAAFGGVMAPVVIYSIFNAGSPDTAHGWGVPTATDIAFALGIMSLLGNRIPNGIRVFLSTLAVADDIIAILVIAIFYGHSPSVAWLLAALLVLLVLIGLNRSHVYALAPYLSLGVVLWFCVYMSGVHSTIAGVLLAFTIPSGSRVNLKSFIAWSGKKLSQARNAFRPDVPVIGQKEYIRNVDNLSKVARLVVPPATRLEHRLYPWVYFVILPLFALTNADVRLVGLGMGDLLSSPVLYGVSLGLLLGKPIGIMLLSFLIVKVLKLASLPENVTWTHMLGASILGGVGFTMAIFVANLAFDSAQAVTMAKAAILLASTVAGVTGFLFLMIAAKRDAKRGVAYVAVVDPDDTNLQYADREIQRKHEDLVSMLDEESQMEYEDIQQEFEEDPLVSRPKELVVRLRGFEESHVEEDDGR